MKWLTLCCLLLLGSRSWAQTYTTGYERLRYQAQRTYARPAYQAPAKTPPCLTCDHCQVTTGSAPLAALTLDLQAQREGLPVRLDFFWEMDESLRSLSLWYRPTSKASLYELQAFVAPFPPQFLHPDPSPEAGYYQLRALTADRATVYSPLREVAACEGVPGLNIYPNPAADWLRLKLPGPAAAGWHYTLRDAQGRQLRQGLVPADATLRDLDRLAPGLYLLEVTNGGHRWRARWLHHECPNCCR